MRRSSMRSFLGGALALVLVAAVAGPVAAVVSPSEQAVMVAAHNQLRQTVAAAETARLGKPVTIPDVTWSPEAAAVAQAWADHLLATDTFEHNANRGPFGENIYWEAGFDPNTGAARAAGNWAGEQSLYTWDTNSCAGVCGHYTQMVWAKTTAIGCGMATDGTQSYWVCNYAPPGNWNGERPYEPGTGPVPAPVASTAPAPAPVASTAPAPVASTAPAPAPAASTAPAPAASTAPAPAPVTSTAPAPAARAVDPTGVLAAHNTLRQTVAAAETARLGQAVTIPDLTWNPEAAAVAQAWADSMLASGAFEHNANRGPFGENIYWEAGFDPATSAERAAGNWAGEQASYTWDTNSCSAQCGHYTQMVWAATTSVGCGVATDGTQTYWVCDYAPPGNFNGERPYEPGVIPAPAPSTAPAPVESTAPAPAPSTAPAPAESTAPAPAPSTAPAPVESTAPAPAESTAPAPVESTAPAPAESTAPAPAESVAPAPVPATVDATGILPAHNTLRQSVAAAETARLGSTVTIPDLTWNAEAAAVAQAWADNLLATDTFEHNPDAAFGENIYWESGSDPATSADRAASSWASEQASYTWDTDTCTDVCGHYTQMVWAATTSVGCGVATNGTTTIWVCDYAPPGNFTGERPYEPEAAVAPVAVESAPPAEAPVDPVDPEASAAPADPAG